MSLVQNTAALNASWDKQNLLNTESIDASVNQSIRSYSSNQEYLFAMREDLAEWLKVKLFDKSFLHAKVYKVNTSFLFVFFL